MHSDLDAQLLRRFATAAPPLADAAFTARVEQQLRARRRFELSAGTLYSTLATLVAGVGGALVLPWRLRHGRLMLVGAAAVSLWTAFL
jgi:hypothetical protein